MQISRINKRSASVIASGDVRMEAVRFPNKGGPAVIDLRLTVPGARDYLVTMSLNELAEATMAMPVALSPTLPGDVAGWVEAQREMSTFYRKEIFGRDVFAPAQEAEPEPEGGTDEGAAGAKDEGSDPDPEPQPKPQPRGEGGQKQGSGTIPF